MREERKGPYRNPMDYTSRSGNLAPGGPGVHDSREQKRAALSFGVGGVAGNPRNADSHTIEMTTQAQAPYENSYKDWRGTLPPLAYQETKPVPARYAMTQGQPQGAIDAFIGNTPTTPLALGLASDQGALAAPRNPILDDPGISSGQSRTRFGTVGLGMLPPVPGAQMELRELLLANGGLPPGVMPKKPEGTV